MDEPEDDVDEDIIVESEDERPETAGDGRRPETDGIDSGRPETAGDGTSADALLLVAAKAGVAEEADSRSVSGALPQPESVSPMQEGENREAEYAETSPPVIPPSGQRRAPRVSRYRTSALQPDVVATDSLSQRNNTSSGVGVTDSLQSHGTSVTGARRGAGFVLAQGSSGTSPVDRRGDTSPNARLEVTDSSAHRNSAPSQAAARRSGAENSPKPDPVGTSPVSPASSKMWHDDAAYNPSLDHGSSASEKPDRFHTEERKGSKSIEERKGSKIIEERKGSKGSAASPFVGKGEAMSAKGSSLTSNHSNHVGRPYTHTVHDTDLRHRELYGKVADLDVSTRVGGPVHKLVPKRHSAQPQHHSVGRTDDDEDEDEDALFFAKTAVKLQESLGAGKALRREHHAHNAPATSSRDHHPHSASPYSASPGHHTTSHMPKGARPHADEELPDLKSFSKEDTVRLTKIQASTRGLLSRKHHGSSKSPKHVAHHENSSHHENLPDLSSFSTAETVSLVKIQAGARGLLARKSLEAQLAMTKHDSKIRAEEASELPDLSTFTTEDMTKLTKIQAAARGSLFRKQHRKIANAPNDTAHHVQCREREDLVDLSSFSKEDMTRLTKIQAVGRGLLARKHNTQFFGRSFASHGRISLNVPHARQANSNTVEENHLLAKLGASAHGHRHRKHASNSCESEPKKNTKVEPNENVKQKHDDDTDLPDLAAFTEEQTAKVTKIQASARGLLARRQTTGTNGKVKIERLPATTAFSQDDAAKLTRVQAVVRGNIARKSLKTQPQADEDLDPAYPSDFSRDDTVKVVKLQALARGSIARKRTAALLPSGTVPTAENEPEQPGDVSEQDQAKAPLLEQTQLHLIRPPGHAPRDRRPMLRCRPLPNADKVLSEEALIRRAEKKLGQIVHSTLQNVPTYFPRPPRTPPRMALESLSSRAREGMLQTARLEAEAWLRDAKLQVENQKQRVAVESKLQQWHAQREAVKQSREEEKRAEEAHQEKVEQLERRKWRRRGENLRDQVAHWGAEKAVREEQELKESAAVAEAKKKREVQRRQDRQRKQKKQLARWYCGLPVEDPDDEKPATKVRDRPANKAKVDATAETARRENRSNSTAAAAAALKLVYDGPVVAAAAAAD